MLSINCISSFVKFHQAGNQTSVSYITQPD